MHTYCMSTCMQTAHHSRWRNWLLKKMRLISAPQVKLYHGFGHEGKLTIYGHVLKLSPYPRNKYRSGFLRNTVALLRLFMVRPLCNVSLTLHWKGRKIHTETEQDGFFKFDWDDDEKVPSGWHTLSVEAFLDDENIATAEGSIYIPPASQYVFISDIDDTFLISHSKNIHKRLFVLFTNNAHSRKPFEGVVQHYQMLQRANTNGHDLNPFFYVSSSEWNLYDYLVEFTHKNELPEGIFLLNQLKVFSQLLKTGQNNHQAKFARIVRIMEAFPHQRVILLGDSSQHDPYIYEAIVKHFPKQVHAVYIRDIYEKSRDAVAGVLKNIEAAGVPCCFFKLSKDAILHSIKIGLIPAGEVEQIQEKE